MKENQNTIKPEETKKFNWNNLIKILGIGAGVLLLGDYIEDGTIDLFGLTSKDFDDDGIPNDVEIRYNMDPRNADTDGDGVNDTFELTAMPLANGQIEYYAIDLNRDPEHLISALDPNETFNIQDPNMAQKYMNIYETEQTELIESYFGN